MRPRHRWSLRARLAVITGLALAMTALAVSSIAWLGLRQSLLTQADGDLDAVTRGSLGLVDATVIRQLPRPSPLSGGAEMRIQLLAANGTSIRPPGQGPLPLTAEDRAVAAGTAAATRRTVDTVDGRFRVLTVRMDNGRTFQVGRSLREDDATLSRFGIMMTLLALGAAAVAVLAGRAVATTGLQPIHRLTATAARIAATQDLKHPISVNGPDEIVRLARAFNTMLTAIDQARQAQQRLVEDAAHELRTPMTSLRTNIDLLVQAGDRLPPADRDNLLRDLRRQNDELADLVRELVSLARAESAQDPPLVLDLADLVTATVERARLHFPASRFTVVTTPATVFGRPAALERMLMNLIDNAVKYGPPAGPVEIRLGHDDAGSHAELTVADHGPGISAADRPRVFDRFYRADSTRSVRGSGLGLAIVAQIVADHHGTATVGHRAGGGASLRVRVPLHSRRTGTSNG